MEWNERNRKWKHFWDCRRGRSRHCCLKGRRSWRWNNRITFFEFMMTFVPLLLLLFTRRFPRSFPADSRPIQNACVGSFAVLLFFHSFILLPSFPFLPCRRPPFTAAGCVCVCGKNEVFLKFFYSFGFFGWTAEISWSRPDWAGLVCVCVWGGSHCWADRPVSGAGIGGWITPNAWKRGTACLFRRDRGGMKGLLNGRLCSVLFQTVDRLCAWHCTRLFVFVTFERRTRNTSATCAWSAAIFHTQPRSLPEFNLIGELGFHCCQRSTDY